MVYGSIILAIAVGTFAFILYSNSHTPRAINPATGSAQQVGEKVPLQAATHVAPGTPVRYQTDPPASGPHYSVRGEAPVPWGFYARQYPPEDWVHNLEHGGVAILYQCPQPQGTSGAEVVETDLSCPEEQDPVREFVASAPHEALFQEVKIVATPYPVPGHRFALVAWGWRLFMDEWDASLAEKFYEAHVDNGPERIP